MPPVTRKQAGSANWDREIQKYIDTPLARYAKNPATAPGSDASGGAAETKLDRVCPRILKLPAKIAAKAPGSFFIWVMSRLALTAKINPEGVCPVH